MFRADVSCFKFFRKFDDITDCYETSVCLLMLAFLLNLDFES